LKISQENGLKNYEAYAYNYLGNIEKDLGNNLKSIEYLIKSAQLFRELKLFDIEAQALLNIGTTFGREKDVKNSLAYFNQALTIFTSTKDTFYISGTIIDIGELYRTTNQPDSAFLYYSLALKSIEDFQNKDFQYLIEDHKQTIYGNLGMVYFTQGKIDSAIVYLEQANTYFTQNFDAYRKSVYQCDLGKIHLLKGNVAAGEKLINESLELAKKEQLKEQIRDFSLELSTFYEQQQQPAKALFYHKQYVNYNDSLKNVENVRKMEQQQSEFQLSIKEEEITNLNRINRLQRILGYGLFAGVLAVLVFIIVLFLANRKIKHFNRQLQEQKLLVEEREKEKGLLLRELNHRVKNNLQMVASLLSLHSRQLKGHPAAEALMEGKYRVEALTLIHQKLYRDDVDTKIDLKDYIEELTKNLVMNFGQNFKLELQLLPVIMKIDKAIPLGLVLNELITNSLKYGQDDNPSPRLSLTIHKTAEDVILIIEDNGKGLPADFDFKKTDSFGLKLVHSLIKQLGGTIEWKSDKGTKWMLTLNMLKIS